MKESKSNLSGISFSVSETARPRFDAHKIRIDESKQTQSAGMPKPMRKLVVGRSGKIGFSK